MAGKRLAGALCIALALFTQGTARAQQAGFSVDRFEPAERGSEWFVSDSLDLRGKLRPFAGITAEGAYRPLVIYKPDGDVRSSVVRDQVFFHLGGSLVLFDRFRIAATLPLQVFADGHAGRINGQFYPAPENSFAIGDMRFSSDVRLFGTYGDPITAAVGLQVTAPTGDTASYTGDGDARIQPRVSIAGDVSLVTYALRAGYQYRGRSEVFAGNRIGSELVFSLAAGARLLNKSLVIGPELYGSTVVDDGAAFSARSTPVEGLLGGHWTISGLRLGGGLATGLSRGYGSPVFRWVLGVEYAPEYAPPAKPVPKVKDRDGDGIPDELDSCPDVPGVKSDDPVHNGCPAPTDRDGDGILDDVDACPDLPGVRTEDRRTNGCPPDRDGDGIYDSADACPDVPGVEQADPKKNGCPPDSDDDGIIDAEDACPDVPGVKSDNPEKNGCPNPDIDGDGIPNEQDACPTVPGPPDKDPKRNGCPKAFLQGGVIRILDQVKFKPASAEILPGKDSVDVLQAVAKVMKDHPEVKLVRVEGHTDNTGNAAANKRLSAARAASVVKWLTQHGVEAKRLTSTGYGQERPLDSNSTDEGRRNNRRVEFHVADQPMQENP